MSKIISMSDHKKQKQTESFEKVQLSASSLLEDFHNTYVGKELQKDYMKLLSGKGGEK